MAKISNRLGIENIGGSQFELIMAAAHRAALNAVESVHINLVWSPRWDPKIHANEDARMDMGIWD